MTHPVPIARPHTIAISIPLGDFSHRCDWCGQVVLLEYTRLVDAGGETLVECLCRGCRGMALGVENDKWRAEMRAGEMAAA